ncbi:MAG: AraC family transcriptional regulator [Lautropia sp.]|nr:AraC family transcriptional regulator [Lautropia sp.]
MKKPVRKLLPQRQDQNRLHRLVRFHGIELLEANVVNAAFGKHAHDSFAIGAITQGVGGYWCRGAQHALPARTLSLMNPEELHTGYALAHGLRYKMLYVTESAVQQILELDHPKGFQNITPMDHDGRISRALIDLACTLNQPDAWPDYQMRAEEILTQTLALVFERHGRESPRLAGRENLLIRRAQDIIDAHVDNHDTGPLSIQVLATQLGLHPNYFIQSFRRARGMPPHAYLIHRRMQQAKSMLVRGMRAADVALLLGFHDQPHFIRHFRKVFGITPSRLVCH